jgi:hypothetical protein
MKIKFSLCSLLIDLSEIMFVKLLIFRTQKMDGSSKLDKIEQSTSSATDPMQEFRNCFAAVIR